MSSNSHTYGSFKMQACEPPVMLTKITKCFCIRNVTSKNGCKSLR